MIFNIKKKHLEGNSLLITTLAINAILIAVGITLVKTTVDTSYSINAYSNRIISKTWTQSCLEESLYRLKRSTSYTGNFIVNNPSGEGSCNSTVSGSGTIKTVNITGSIDNHNSEFTRYVDTSTDPYTISKTP